MFSLPWRRSPTKVLMLGLDAVGKTTIGYQLRPRVPEYVGGVIGFNVETFTYDSFEITSFDLGGQDKIRIIHRYYYPGTKGLIYVVDSNDRDPVRMLEARNELYLLLAERELAGVPLLVIANKQDLPGHMSASEVAEMLELDSLYPRLWHIQPTCANRRDGLSDGFDWLKVSCNTATPSTMTLQPETYSPGEYFAHTRIEVRPDLEVEMKAATGFVEVGTTISIEEIQIVDHRHYGFIRTPVTGWVFICAHGSGAHLRQHDYVVAQLSCTPNGSGGATIECHSLAGDELVVFSLDESLESVEQFRASLAVRIGTTSACLKLMTPNGDILPHGGSKESLLKALMLKFSDEPTERMLATRQSACLVQ